MNYDKFINLVSNDTKEFVDTLLPLFYYYKDSDKSLKLTKISGYYDSYYSKILSIFLIAYIRKNEYNSLLSKYGFTEQDFSLNNDIDYNISLDKAFPFISDFLPNFNDDSYYCKLTATDILLNVIKICVDEIDPLFFANNFLPRASSIEYVVQELVKFNNREKKNLKVVVEREIFTDLKVGVVNYLETADKLFYILKDKSNFSEDDLVALSLLFSLFFYDDAPEKNNSFSEQQAIMNVLTNKKILLSDLKSKLKFPFNASEINSKNSSIFSVKEKYNKFVLQLEKSMKREEITVSDIFIKVLDKKISNSLIIDKLFAKVGVGTDSFAKLKEEVEKNYNEENRLREEKKIEKFYMNLNKEAKEFIEFVGKTYQLILKKMQNNSVNNKILVNEDDADTLALYIANCYYGLEVDDFFREYGVTLEKVLRLLCLDINKKEIEAISLDKKLLIERFYRFLHEGVNFRSNEVTPENVILNLCDSNFNKSMIMENIFESLNHQVNLEKNFTKQMHEAVKVKILRKENQLREKIFYDLDVDVINVLEKASAIYLMLGDKRKDLEKQDKKAISLLISILYNDKFIREVFLLMDVSYEYILDKMKLKNLGEKISLESIQKDFGDYIFGGYNKDKKRKDIDVYSILRNVFNEELNSSVYYKRFLKSLNLSETDFLSEYEKFSKEVKNEREKEKIEKYIDGFNSSVSLLIKKAVASYEQLDYIVKYKLNDEIISSTSDLVNFSIMLAVLTHSCKEKDFFAEQNITLENVLNKLGIYKDLNFYRDIDYFNFANVFMKYFPLEDQNIKLKDVIRKMFDGNFLEKMVRLFNGNYEILKTEIETGTFYENSLSLTDRIKILNDLKIDYLSDNYDSILNFDNELLFHSKYINRELPKLVQNTVHDNSVETINEVLNRVYSKEAKKDNSKKSFFKMLFGVETNEKEETRIIFNPDAINQLSQKIDEQIRILYSEFRQYEGMSDYIDAYRKKNNTLFLFVKKKTIEIKEKLDSIDKEDENLFGDYLKLNTLYSALCDKANRLLTTNQIMRQNLLSINQNMMMHVLTINTLKMARDDLIPLVVSQLAITKGQVTEKEGIELSENVFSLFQSLLLRNVEGALDNIRDLRKSIIDPETMALLDKDIKNYVEQFELEKSKDGINLIMQELNGTELDKDGEKSLAKKYKI